MGKPSSPSRRASPWMASMAASRRVMSRSSMGRRPLPLGRPGGRGTKKGLQGRVYVLLFPDGHGCKAGMVQLLIDASEAGAVGAAPGSDFAVADRGRIVQQRVHQFQAAAVVRRQIVPVGKVEGVDVVLVRRVVGAEDGQGQLVHGGTAGAAALPFGKELLFRHFPGPGVVGEKAD